MKSRSDEEVGDLTYYLSQYDFEIKYYPGKYNLEADCLSRISVLEPAENIEKKLKIVDSIKFEDILNDYRPHKDVQEERKNRKLSTHLLQKNSIKDKIDIIDIISKDLSVKFIENMQKNFCHIGVKRLQKMIGPLYTTRNITTNMKTICKNCTICIKNKASKKNRD